MNFCCTSGPRPWRRFFLCAKRKMGRLERSTKPRAYGIIPAAAAGRQGRPKILQVVCNSTYWGGALARPKVVPRSQRWACRLLGAPRLDGRTESYHKRKTIPCAHMEPSSTFTSLLLVLQVEQRRQKQSPEAKTLHAGRHTGRVVDCKASGPWQHPSGSCRLIR
jgi:hypothetical protein